MTMSSRSGCVTGLGTPGIQYTGLTLAYRSSAFRRVTFSERKPPPTGVVRGPLSATTYSLIAPRVASGSISPYWNIAFSPAGTAYQAIRRRPPNASSTTASTAFRAARTTSGPTPSPSISGTIGSSGTRIPASVIRILWPPSGGRRTRRSAGIRLASRSLVDRDVDEVLRSDVPVEGPQEPVVFPVLDHLRGPTGDPRDREERGEEVLRDPEAVEHEPGIEVDVRVDVPRGEFPADRVLDRRRDAVVRVVAVHLSEAASEFLEDERARVVRLVDAVAEAEHLLLVPQRVHDEFFRALRPADPFDRFERRFDRASMQRTLQGRDGGDDRAVQVRQRRGRDGRGEGRRVHRVVRVQDERDIHHSRQDGVGSLALHHPEEVLGVPELRVRPNDSLSLPHPLVRRDDRREPADEPPRLAQVCRARRVIPLRIEVVQVGDGRPQDIHRRRVLRHRPEEAQDRRRQRAAGRQVPLRLLQLFPVRQVPLEQEERGLLERRVRREIADVISPVQEAPPLPVDETDRALLHVDVVQALVDPRARKVRLHGAGHRRRLSPKRSPHDGGRETDCHQQAPTPACRPPTRGFEDTKVRLVLKGRVDTGPRATHTGIRTTASTMMPTKTRARYTPENLYPAHAVSAFGVQRNLAVSARRMAPATPATTMYTTSKALVKTKAMLAAARITVEPAIAHTEVRSSRTAGNIGRPARR